MVADGAFGILGSSNHGVGHLTSLGLAGRIQRRALKPEGSHGANDEIRTRDLRFTKPLLYQLSYIGTIP